MKTKDDRGSRITLLPLRTPPPSPEPPQINHTDAEIAIQVERFEDAKRRMKRTASIAGLALLIPFATVFWLVPAPYRPFTGLVQFPCFIAFLWLLHRPFYRTISIHMRVVLRRCPACDQSLRGVPAQQDGCTVCPECGAAWRLPQDQSSKSSS